MMQSAAAAEQEIHTRKSYYATMKDIIEDVQRQGGTMDANITFRCVGETFGEYQGQEWAINSRQLVKFHTHNAQMLSNLMGETEFTEWRTRFDAATQEERLYMWKVNKGEWR